MISRHLFGSCVYYVTTKQELGISLPTNKFAALKVEKIEINEMYSYKNILYAS